MKTELLEQLARTERLAAAPKWRRLLSAPAKYLTATMFRHLVYPWSKKEIDRDARPFFGGDMLVALPAATDIYLTGGKSHPSEIRLARFLILTLEDGDHFLDIGAHYGYFTLLAATLVGEKGKIQSYEPSSGTFRILRHNTRHAQIIAVLQKAVSDVAGALRFFEFPNLYSEYNTLDATQFRGERWFKAYTPVEVTIEATCIDDITGDSSFRPTIIKIDVEGAESSVISGGLRYFRKNSPVIIMEYLEAKRDNAGHRKAASLLADLGYSAFIISADGGLQAVSDVENYLAANNLESDNIVFRK